MTTRTIEIKANLHPGQVTVHQAAARFKVLAAGRRWGKTRLGVLECLDVAAHGGRAWWVAPSYKVSEVGWRPLKRMANMIGAEVRKVDRLVIMPGGGEVGVRSADNPDSLRGEGLDYLVMDECAFVHEDAWTQALRPALSDRKGRALFIGTPKGRNWFWRMFVQGQSGDNDTISWQRPTIENPHIDPAEIEAARQQLPERIFQQEYMATFLDDAGGVFRGVMECATSKALDKPEPGRQYIGGVDVAALTDFTVLSVFDVQARKQVYLDRFNRVDYPVLWDRLEASYKLFGLQNMIVEANSIGEPTINELRRRGLSIQPFTTTQATKDAIIRDLQSAFEQRQIAILPDPVQVGELQAFEMERTASGLFRYSAPDGMHDDTVMALALANSGLTNRVQVIANPFYD